MKKTFFLVILILVNFLFILRAEETRAVTNLMRMRSGIHDGFSRVVLDSQGDLPLAILRLSAGEVDIQYEDLNLIGQLEDVLLGSAVGITGVEVKRGKDASHLLFTLRQAGSMVKTMYLPAVKSGAAGDYRLVLDIYPEPSTASGKPAENQGNNIPVKGVILASLSENSEQVSENKTDPPSRPVLSGGAELTIRGIDRERDSSIFEEYRRVPEPLSGNIEVRIKDRERYSLKIKGEDIAEDDQHLGLDAEWFGKMKINLDYREIPHRFQYGAKSLYSGIGSGTLLLDDTIQATLQATPAADVANQLRLFFNSAVSGDPELERRQGTVKMDLVNFDPYRFTAEFKREKREGTRPYFGAFGLTNTVEILEPIDYETTEIRLASEYAPGPFLLRASYYFSTFKNRTDTLIWDNPLRLNDALLGPSRGLIDLPPNNRYHNLSLDGTVASLPFHTRISANVSFGWMLQDDMLSPYTINSAIVAPAVPAQKVNAEVKTSLYDFKLTSRPWDRLRMTGKFRHYAYDNKTQQISFAGFVDTDDIFINTPVINLPISYKKTTAGTSLAYDLYSNTTLTFFYDYEKMDRTNREVSSQDDHKLKGAIDTSPLKWLNLHASYERTIRDIENYNFDIYLAAGENLTQNPLLRKYDEADMNRDRFKFLTTITPFEDLVLSGSVIYGLDDFDNSTLGLLEDKHYILSFDVDYVFNNRLQMWAFYTYERYKNVLAGNGLAGGTVTDWLTNSEDKIYSFGSGVNVHLIDNKLDLDISYTYSVANGEIHFDLPTGGFVDFNTVDETHFHQFETKLSYTYSKHWVYSLGYLREKFDYRDFDKQGFMYVPANNAGLYQGALLMGILPEDYLVNIIYLKLAYLF